MRLVDILVDLGARAPTGRYSYSLSLLPSPLFSLMVSLMTSSVVPVGVSPRGGDDDPADALTLDAGGNMYVRS